MKAELIMGLGELVACARLHAVCFPAEPWSVEDLQSLSRLPGSLAWHLQEDTALLGFVLARQSGVEAEVLTLAVDCDFRRQGLGKVMMIALIEDLRRRGVPMLYLEMGRFNEPAALLYSSLGFSEVGIRERYYRDGEDAVVLRLAIDKCGASDRTVCK